MLLKAFHVALAYTTAVGFLIRGIWALTDSPLRQQKWVKVTPHVVDTLLLILGVIMAYRLSLSPVSGWLGAKLAGLVVYIGFGVLTMRAPTRPLQLAGFAGALLTLTYIFAVAFTRSPWPF